ncbi:MAG: hypothetical protein ACTSWN_05025, partial [Promethearchaeota archaeon]
MKSGQDLGSDHGILEQETGHEQSEPGTKDITRALIDAFSDDKVKEEILEMLHDDEHTLDNLLKGAASWCLINTYKISYSGATRAEKAFRLFTELKSLFGDTVTDEIKIQERVTKFHDSLFELLLKTPKIKKDKKKSLIISDLEGDLLEILRTLPEYYFFDFLESLIDINKLKADSNEYDGDDLDADGSGIEEMFEFNRFRQTIIRYLRIESLKDIELMFLPLKKILDTIFDQNMEMMPISRRGIEAFAFASNLKTEIIDQFKKGNEARESLDRIEGEITEIILERLKEKSDVSPQDFLYYLQKLLNVPFSGLVQLLKSYEIDDIPLFIKAISLDLNKIEYNLAEKGIAFEDLNRLKVYDGDLTGLAQMALEDYKSELKTKGAPGEDLLDLTIDKVIENELADLDNPAMDFIIQVLNIDRSEFVDLILLEIRAKEAINPLNIKD